MTEGPSAPGDRRNPGLEPALRASHADRDRTVEVLRDAAGDGRLSASELDERVEAALTARTGSELAALTADLPAAPGRQAKELVRIDQRFGEVTRTGRHAGSRPPADAGHGVGDTLVRWRRAPARAFPDGRWSAVSQ
jgi:hypothetical protein